MTQHYQLFMAIPRDGDTETSASSLPKRISDALSGKTLVSISLTRYGAYLAALVVFSD